MPTSSASAWPPKIEEVFRGAGIPYEIFTDVKANPTIANVQHGVAAFGASGADFIVALGGGSVIDTAKGVGIVTNNPEFADVKSLEGPADTHRRAVPTFALPTTAGTAAEVTINYVIIDEEARKKMVWRRSQRHSVGGHRRSRTDVFDAQGADRRDGYGRPDPRHRGLYYQRCVDDVRHVRTEGHRADRATSQSRRR